MILLLGKNDVVEEFARKILKIDKFIHFGKVNNKKTLTYYSIDLKIVYL